ncbi:uncharacterized protein RHOBADRAFT_46807 [Rhodotorula graminis WP1]|uniref:Uncharacterized protein n=1 Tax=Rhodotorula graminis (strain WP1) TaxID=578459 RepID=A0A0N8PZH7_RHOGW|nr:uncharacterized protein RHOBADRAFT_46807 [Rhodotorula graminis WP1]KPV72357.1 hypothetical protein RHOBADRAFT_46807 [Rhodotorula graminis WP1]
MAPRARLVFQLAPPPPPAGPAPSPTSGARADRPRPLPHPPAQLASQGVFSILPAGGARVGARDVRVPAGSAVERVGKGTVALAESAEGLRWAGTDQQGRPGHWTLWLLDATEGDVLAVERILATSRPHPARPQAHVHARQAPPPPRLRNSILLYDESSRSALAILPLSSPPTSASSTPPPRPPRPLTHSHSHIAPSPTHHPSAAAFAAYVNHVSASIHPSPTPETLRRDDRVARREIERLAAEETADDELRLPPAPEMLELVVLPSVDGLVDTSVTAGAASPEEPRWRDERDVLVKGLERLDLETELARPVLHGPSSVVASPPHSSRQGSSWTVSSWATRGTERFMTADEGGVEDGLLEDGPASAFTARADDDATPRPSYLNTRPPVSTASPTSLADPAFQFDLAHTLTNGNASP